MARSKMSVYVKPAGAAPVVKVKENALPPDIDVGAMENAEVAKAGKGRKGGKKLAAQTAPAPASDKSQLTLSLSISSESGPRTPPEPADPESTQMGQEMLEAPTEKLTSPAMGPITPPLPLLPLAPPSAAQVSSDSAPMAPSTASVSSPSSALSDTPAMASSMLDPLRVLEAALFMSSQSMHAQELGKLVGIGAVGHVSGLLSQLAEQYRQSGSSLEVVEENPGKWAMRIRAAFAPAVRRFAGEAEIPRHALRTLAYISRHEGITKRELFRRLGGSIYEDAGELVEKGFVMAKPAGRTMSLNTTPKFRQYFQE